MRILTATVCIALTALLSSCDQQRAPEVDPMLGLACFESHRAALQPGTQYEGIKKFSENILTIKVMNGVDVVTLECLLTPDGALQKAGK